MTERGRLHLIKGLAQDGIHQAAKARKYQPAGPYSPVEQALFKALLAIRQRTQEMIDDLWRDDDKQVS
jgi:hypothetical protein